MFDNIHYGNTYKFLYSGEWIYSVNKHTIEVRSPYDKKILGLIQCVTKDEIDMCLDSAKKSLGIWHNNSYEHIKKTLNLVAQFIMENCKHLSRIISLETGKKLLLAEEEVLRTYNFLTYITKNDENIFVDKKISFIKSQPVGTILITPSVNLPLYSTTSKVISALISGNSVVINPSINGTLSVLHISEILNKSCNVPGIINTITGVLEPLYDYLINHKNINFIDFTGDTSVGKYIAISSKNIPLNIQNEETYINNFGVSLKEDINNIEENIARMSQKYIN